MNFIFSCSTRHLTSERSERVRYRVEHSKIKFISTGGHEISSICTTVLFYYVKYVKLCLRAGPIDVFHLISSRYHAFSF